MNVVLPSLLDGFVLNIRLFVTTLLLSVPLGLVIMYGSMTKILPIRWVSRLFVWIIRGTPLMLQLIIVMYVPGLLRWPIQAKSRMGAALAAFVINYAAYFSEIYRGGIESISVGQYEAGQVLGMTRPQVFFRVVLLQVVKRVTPAMSNEVITLVKDTSLARIIGVTEIIMSADRFTKQGLIWPLFTTGLFFLAFSGLLTILFRYAEDRMDFFRA
ncbi:MAG: amino acid ABC transporter permease [Oscillospiraceae bacterium]|jgi:polar amino acid transport system permease protein|nr:amino acid ABC transporter permease [Oscillospiraceae bacterium]